MTTKYVHNGKEVLLTGRTATRELRSGKSEEIFEIQPDGVSGKQYNSWVSMKELFKIIDNGIEE